MIPVTVVTGFLGSGKTTLIGRVLSGAEFADAAVIVNEFGETDLDHSLIAASSDNILQLMSGCICCTIREDLALELRNLYLLRTLGDVSRFNRVIIETTGIADPVPIVHTFMANTELRKVYRMQAVVTLVDAVAGDRTLDDQRVSVQQVALADHVLITKTDIVDEGQLCKLEQRLSSINPSARIERADDADLAALFRGNYYPVRKQDAIEGWMVADAQEDHAHPAHGDSIVNFSLVIERPLSLAEVVLFFQELVNYRPDNLLRVKGLIAVAGRLTTPAVVHCIRDKVYPLVWLDHWPGSAPTGDCRAEPLTRLVFITQDMHKAEVEKIFHDACGW